MDDTKMYKVGDLIKSRNNSGIINDAKIKFINNSYECLIFVKDLDQVLAIPHTSIIGNINIGENITFNFDHYKSKNGVIKDIKNTSHFFIEFDNGEKAIVNYSEVALLNKQSVPENHKSKNKIEEINIVPKESISVERNGKNNEQETNMKLEEIKGPKQKTLIEELKPQIDESVLIEIDLLNTYSIEEIVFLLHLELYLEEEDDAIVSHPKLHDMSINLYKLADVVQSYDGFENVKANKRWKDVARFMGVKQSHVSTFKSLKFSYMRYIDPFLKHIHSSSKKECCNSFQNEQALEITQKIKKHFKYDKPSDKIYTEKFDKYKEELDSEDKLTMSNPQQLYSDPLSIVSVDNKINSPEKKRKSSFSSDAQNISVFDSNSTSEKTSVLTTFSPGDKVKVSFGLNPKKTYYATVLRYKQKPNHTRYYINYTNRKENFNEWVHEKHLTLIEKGNQSDSRSTKDPHSGESKEQISLLSPYQDQSYKRKSRSTLNSRQDELLEEILKVSALEYNKSSTKADEVNNIEAPTAFSSFVDELPIQKRKKRKTTTPKEKKQKPEKKTKSSSSIQESPVNNKKLKASATTSKKSSPQTPLSSTERDLVVEKIKEKTNNIKAYMNAIDRYAGKLSPSDLEKLLTESLQRISILRDSFKTGYEFYEKQLNRPALP